MRPVAVPFRLVFEIDFDAGAAWAGRLYHVLEIRWQGAKISSATPTSPLGFKGLQPSWKFFCAELIIS